jgi:thioredoxin-related protein
MTILKKYCSFVVAILICAACHAQVNFVTKGNLRTPFDLAKAQNKKVFLEVYSPDCHTCQLFEPVFKDPKVAKYYNDHFISYRLDANSVETYAFLQKQKLTITSTPTFLFYSADVKIIHKVALTDKQNTAEIVIQAAKKAVGK